MAVIVIAYMTHEINGETFRIYNDSTEQYFESAEIQDAKDYIEYLSTSKGYTVEVAPIEIHTQGSLNIDVMFRNDALSKLTDKEKEILGL